MRHDTVRRPNHLGIDAIVRRIGYKVDAFTAKKPGCPRHMESTGYQNGLLPALLPADFFGESRVFCRISTFIVHKDSIVRNAQRQEHPLFNMRFIGFAFKDGSAGQQDRDVLGLFQAKGCQEPVGRRTSDLTDAVDIGYAGPGAAAEDDDDIAVKGFQGRLVIGRF